MSETKVKIFTGKIINGSPDKLERTINEWLAANPVNVISITVNILPTPVGRHIVTKLIDKENEAIASLVYQTT